MIRNFTTLAALLAVLLWTPTIHAASMLDQAFEGEWIGEAHNGILYRAQTFTVGLSGLLTGFEVYMNGPGGTSDFEIWSTAGGAPEAIPGTALAAGTVSFGASEAWVAADLSASSLNVTAGDVLALVQIGGNSTGSGSWFVGANGYAGGAAFITTTSAPSGAWVNVGEDFLFRTFVDPDAVAAVPLPPALYLFGSGLLGLAAATRKKAA